MIDDIKDSTGVAIRMTSLAAAIAFAFLVTIAFLCAAAFVYVLQNYGPIQACLTGAGIFLAIALIGIAVYTVRKRQARQEAKETAKSALHTALADPVMMATALQVVRAIGIKKLVPILAVGGLALGLLANRPASHEAPAE
jgi:predicted transporter